MKKAILITIIISAFVNSFAQIKVSSSNNIGIGDISDPGAYRLWMQNGSCRFMVGGNTYGRGADLFRLYNNIGPALIINSYNNLNSYLITDIGINYAVNGDNSTSQNCPIGSKYGPVIRLSAEDGSISLFGENGPTGSNNRSPYLNLGVYVAKSGYVGIGTSSPKSALDVTGKISINGSVVLGSDSRLKENIMTLPSSLKKVSDMRAVKYKLKQPNNNGNTSLLAISKVTSDSSEISNMKQPVDTSVFNRYHNGFIAEELQTIYPELVYKDQNGILSIDYIGLIPVLTSAIKEQEALIEDQAVTIKSQNDDIAAIKSQLAEIQKQLVKQKN